MALGRKKGLYIFASRDFFQFGSICPSCVLGQMNVNRVWKLSQVCIDHSVFECAHLQSRRLDLHVRFVASAAAHTDAYEISAPS